MARGVRRDRRERAMATPTGFEPAISTLTVWCVKPGYTTGPRAVVTDKYYRSALRRVNFPCTRRQAGMTGLDGQSKGKVAGDTTLPPAWVRRISSCASRRAWRPVPLRSSSLPRLFG